MEALQDLLERVRLSESLMNDTSVSSTARIRLETTPDEDWHCLQCGEVLPWTVIPMGGRYLHRREQCRCERETARLVAEVETRELTDRTMRTWARFPVDFRRITFADVRAVRGMERAIQAAKQFAEGFSHSHDRTLIISGEVGCGKTMLAACVGNAIIARRYWVQCLNLVNYLESIRRTWGRSDAAELMPEPPSPDLGLLVLDDLGTQAQAWHHDHLYNIVNRRYMNHQAMLVTTNCRDERELLGCIGQRVLDRLLHRGDWVDITAPSYRMAEYRRRKASK